MSGTAGDGLVDFLRRSFSSLPSNTAEADLPHLSPQLYSNQFYTENEKVEISQWLITSSHLATHGEDAAKHIERLGSLNIHLSARTTLLGAKPSIADLAVYFRLGPTVRAWSPEERTGEKGYHHIVRHTDFVQNSSFFGLSLDASEKVAIDPDDVEFVHKPVDAKEERERKKKEKSAAAAVAAGIGEPASQDKTALPVGRGKEEAEAGKKGQGVGPGTVEPAAAGKKAKKEKAPKPQKAPPAVAPLSPRLIDLRVGHILKAVQHPDADSLYVSTIACGDAAGTDNTSEYGGQIVRTVCSGLNGLIPLEQMQGRKIIAVCNLKPVTMRGVKSAAMVLAASPRLKEGEVDDHKGPVELVNPPEDAAAGDRVVFEGWEGEPEGQLNPKKKIFETLQPGLTTNEQGLVAFDASVVEPLKESASAVGTLKTKSGGTCSVESLKGAVVR